MIKHPLALLPSITLSGGTAPLAPSGYGPSTGAGTAAQAIASWVGQGAAWVHLVDADARAGSGHNLGHVVASGAHMEYEGAVHDDATLREALATEASRIVIDPTDAAWAHAALAAHHDRLAVGVDVRHPDLLSLARDVERSGGQRLVVSNRAEKHWRHDLHLLGELCSSTNLPVTALGGVAHLGDLHSLHDLVPHGLDSIVIDEGLHDGGFTYSEALAAGADRFDMFSWGPPS